MDEKKNSQEKHAIVLGRVNFSQKLVFVKYLSIMLKSGLTISDALEIAHDQANGKFKSIVNKILLSVRSGNSLSDSLQKHPKVFSSLIINSVYAGEISGTLEENLSSIAKQLEEEKNLKNKIKNAMVYPTIILTFTFLVGMTMAVFVLPKITPLFKGMAIDLPITTKALIYISELVEDRGLFIFGMIILLSILTILIFRQKLTKPATSYLTLHLPLIKKISKNYNLANFCLTFATMLKSGISIEKALTISAKTSSNYHYQKTLLKVAKKIAGGNSLSENLSSSKEYFPKLMTSMIKVGEKSGNLEETLNYLADFYKKEVDFATKNLSTAIEPILLLFIGIVVALLAMSIITPIYQITGNVY